MTYAVKQDLIDRWGEKELIQLTDRSNVPPTTVNETTVTKALTDADSLLNSYIAKRYTLPLDPAPAILTRLAADITRYYLFGRVAEKDGEVERAYQEALSWAKDVSRGLVQLEDGGTPATQTGGGEVRTSGPDRVFTRDSLKGF